MRPLVLVLAGVAALAQPAFAQQALAVPERPTVDVYIRSQAGLPASSARGDLEVVHMGEHSLDAVLSIVGHRTAGGWRVSYVCAQSPSCDPKKFILAKEFDLSADAAKRVDAVLDRLKVEPESDGRQPAQNQPCGRLGVAIDDHGVKHSWRRACSWGADFAQLEILLKAGLP
jgi:hypothetical protein